MTCIEGKRPSESGGWKTSARGNRSFADGKRTAFRVPAGIDDPEGDMDKEVSR